MTTPPTDPAGFMRDMLGQWEQFTNRFGGDVMKSEQFAQGLHGATAASMQGQAATHDFMAKWLAAVNMPSRAEFEDLSGRLARIEEAIGRIEDAVAPKAAPARPRPARTRQAPAKPQQAKP
ncbi:MAG: hypothetical protein V4659_01320 [Pseudomonadota bacterium]